MTWFWQFSRRCWSICIYVYISTLIKHRFYYVNLRNVRACMNTELGGSCAFVQYKVCFFKYFNLKLSLKALLGPDSFYCLMHYRMCSNLPDLYPPYANIKNKQKPLNKKNFWIFNWFVKMKWKEQYETTWKHSY